MTSDCQTVGVINYGCGNVQSVTLALRAIGADPILISPCDGLSRVTSCRSLVLPGVGAFATVMQRLQDTGFNEILIRAAGSGCHIFGICAGMQVLFDWGDEGGKQTAGLGLLSGFVDQLPLDEKENEGVKLPNVGWKEIRSHVLDFPSVDPFRPSNNFYFVHSYKANPVNQSIVAASSSFGSNSFPAIVKAQNILGIQFHPEKSGPNGINLLRKLYNMGWL